jgi:hypothetical protein
MACRQRPRVTGTRAIRHGLTCTSWRGSSSLWASHAVALSGAHPAGATWEIDHRQQRVWVGRCRCDCRLGRGLGRGLRTRGSVLPFRPRRCSGQWPRRRPALAGEAKPRADAMG